MSSLRAGGRSGLDAVPTPSARGRRSRALAARSAGSCRRSAAPPPRAPPLLGQRARLLRRGVAVVVGVQAHPPRLGAPAGRSAPCQAVRVATTWCTPAMAMPISPCSPRPHHCGSPRPSAARGPAVQGRDFCTARARVSSCTSARRRRAAGAQFAPGRDSAEPPPRSVARRRDITRRGSGRRSLAPWLAMPASVQLRGRTRAPAVSRQPSQIRCPAEA